MLDDIKLLLCKYLFIKFMLDCEIGNDFVKVENVFKLIEGVKIFDNISFMFCFNEKMVLISCNDLVMIILM